MIPPILIIFSATCAASLALQGVAVVNQIRHNAKMFNIIGPDTKSKD